MALESRRLVSRGKIAKPIVWSPHPFERLLMLKAPATLMSALVFAGFAVGGCGSNSDSSSAPSVPSASSLVGTWSASQVGYGNGVLEGPYPSAFIIKKADDSSRSFTGMRVVSSADAKKYDIPARAVGIDGVITTWGEISMVHGEGTWTLEMDGDKMVGRYLEIGSDLAAKSITLSREK